ncbi:MAG: FAD-dependent oxidoreductase, partial [Acidobacteriota bacterium]
MGSYNSDSHNVQRFVNARGLAENEGDMQVAVQPYQIPFRMILPKRAEAANLLVPVCFSASHVAYSSARMEPQYMIIGHAAGVAAALAIRDGKPVQEIAVPELQKILKSQAAIFEYVPYPQQEALGMLRRMMAPPQPIRFNWE